MSKGLRGGATHWSAFHTFVLLLFIYQVSLPARTWYLKIGGLCESLTVSVTGSHHVPLLELLLRWSNRNLGNLMFQLSEPFPTGEKVKPLPHWRESSDTAMDEKSALNTNVSFKKALFLFAHVFCVLCCLVRSNQTVNPSRKSLITIWWVWEESHCVTSWKLVISSLCCCYNLVLAVFNVSVQIVLSLEVMAGEKKLYRDWRSLILFLSSGEILWIAAAWKENGQYWIAFIIKSKGCLLVTSRKDKW